MSVGRRIGARPDGIARARRETRPVTVRTGQDPDAHDPDREH